MFTFFTKKSPANSSSANPTTQVRLKINGMHCVSCALNIDGAIEELSGVVSAETNYAKSETNVEFDPKQVELDQIKSAIQTQGYQVL